MGRRWQRSAWVCRLLMIFLWYLCVCFSVSCSFWITVFVSGLLGVAFLPPLSVYNTYIKGKWKTFQTLHKPYTLPFIYLIISILQSVGFMLNPTRTLHKTLHKVIRITLHRGVQNRSQNLHKSVQNPTLKRLRQGVKCLQILSSRFGHESSECKE